jgi:hypothetical protein
MSAADKALDRIEAIVDEIDRLQRALGFPCNDPSHREPGDILERIIRQREATRQVAAE